MKLCTPKFQRREVCGSKSPNPVIALTTVAHPDLHKLTPIGESRMRLRSITSYFAVCALALGTLVLTCAAPNDWAQSPAAGSATKPPYNIIFVISDQEADHLLASGDFELPARAELR